MSEELPPIRCLSCGRVLAHRWNDYKRLLAQGKTQEEALNAVGLKNICCRLRMRNPGIIIDSSVTLKEDTQELEKSFNRLSMSENVKTPTQGALSSVTKVTSFSGGESGEQSAQQTNQRKPIIEKLQSEEEEIELPALGPLPSLQKIGEKKIVRTYQAW